MNPREKGFLLLSSRLGDPDRRPLSMYQLHNLAERVRKSPQENTEGTLEFSDLLEMGLDRTAARKILILLEDDALLRHYVANGLEAGCVPITRVSEGYPLILRQRLGLDSPGCLWAKGDLSLLERPGISLVGSRDLLPENRDFARQVGQACAEQGIVLISGNARGADQTAQQAALEKGGSVICVVADELWKHPVRERVLYLSEDSYEEVFSARRALSRNRVIHSLGLITLAAQSRFQTGGTWDGTSRNLRLKWSPVFVFQDGSQSAAALEEMGAIGIGMDDLSDLAGLPQKRTGLYSQYTLF